MMAKVQAETATPGTPEATPLADAALQLLANFFADRAALAAFLSTLLALLDSRHYLALSPVPFIDASEVLRHWESRAEYLDATGGPAILPGQGPRSFAELSAAACPDLPAELVLEALCKSGAVERTSAGLRMTARAALIREASQAAHARAARMATRLLRTLHDNLGSHHPADHLFERSAVISGIPATQLPAVKAFLARHGQQFLEDADDTLARLVENGSTEPADTGVCLFLFRDPPHTAR